jgi:hypothetical protein
MLSCSARGEPVGGELLNSFFKKQNSESRHICHGDPSNSQGSLPASKARGKRISRTLLQLSLAAALLTFPILANSQSLPFYEVDPFTSTNTTSGNTDLTYVRPTEKTKIINYVFDTFGPYPIVGAAFGAGINQFSNAPPEWNQGAAGYARRFGSDYGIAVVATSTRYGLSEAFREDAMYYRCECRGIFPRMRHALVSTLTARRGEDGARVFSIPALVGPYAGTMTATYGWFPNRYGAKDAFRAGNYSLLAFAGENVALEFFYSGPHSLLSRMHLNNAHGAPDPGPNH